MTDIPTNSAHYSRFTELFPELELRDYVDAGYELHEATSWIQAGFPLRSAERWRWYGFDVETALQLMDVGVDDPANARSALRTADLLTILRWVPHGVVETAKMHLANTYVEQGLTDKQAAYWLAARDQLVKLPSVRYRRLLHFFDPAESAAWIRAGIVDPSEVFYWRQIAVDPRVAGGYHRVGVTPAQAARWLTSPISTELALASIGAGLSVREAEGLDADKTETWDMLTALAALRQANLP